MTSALISYCLGKGHTCVELKDFEKKEFDFSEGGELNSSEELYHYKYPPLDEWIEILKKSNVLGMSEDNKLLIADNNGRLYFQKFYKYEKELGEKLLAKADGVNSVNDKTIEAMNLLFADNSRIIDYQKIAAMVALLKNLCIISGGAGTGKTYTAAMILSLLLVENPSCKIALAAPTGKAANRLLESVNEHCQIFKGKLQDLPERSMPDKGYTIHRLLGASGSRLGFYYNDDRPLPYDVLIVDEVSMADLVLVVHLFRAMKKDAKIILIGDKNQLTSVEAGTVLGEICAMGKMNNFTPTMIDALKRFNQADPSALTNKSAYKLQDCMVELIENRRQEKGSKVGELAQLVNTGKSSEVLELMESRKDIDFLPSNKGKFPEKIKGLIDKYYIPLLNNKISVNEAFDYLKKFRILTPYKTGDFSVEFMNMYVENYLRDKGLIKPQEIWYSGRPILIHKNDYNVNLFNGDVGIFLKDQDKSLVYFEGKDGDYKALVPTLLPIHETAYSMTVHKSQGSEFDEVLLVFGNRSSHQLVSRQLIYTAITRAKKELYIFGDESILHYAIENPLKRYSALGDYLKVK